MSMTEQDWIQKFEEIEALWRMNYDADGAIALLTSGNLSDGFMNCTKIMARPELVSEVAAGIIEKLKNIEGYETPDWVVGPAYGAIAFGFEVARQLNAKFAFTEIEYTDEGKMQVLKRFDIPSDAKVLVIEDITTTGGSALKTINVLKEQNIDVLPVVGLVLNRSGKSEIEGYTLTALVDFEMNVWTPEELPESLKDRETVRPKADWDKLAR